MAISHLAIFPPPNKALGDDEPPRQALVYLVFFRMMGNKAQPTPCLLQVINTVQNSTFVTGKCFLLLFKVAPDADVLSTQRK